MMAPPIHHVYDDLDNNHLLLLTYNWFLKINLKKIINYFIIDIAIRRVIYGVHNFSKINQYIFF